MGNILLAGADSPLFSEAYWDVAGQIAERWPTSSLYFERSLGKDGVEVARDTQTDLLVAIAAYDSEALGVTLGTEAAHWSGCAPIKSFCSAWNDDRSPIYHRVSALWLEYDSITHGEQPPCPSLSACLLPRYRARTRLPPTDVDKDLDLMAKIIRTARGESLPDSVRAQLLHFLRSLSSEGRVIHLSVMLGRSAPVLKLYGVVPRASFLVFLQQLNWRGSISEMTALVHDFCPVERVGDELYVDVTLDGFDAPGGSRIGLVFSPQHLNRTEESSPMRTQLLNALTERQLCTPEQRDLLMQWPACIQHPGTSHMRRRVIQRWLDLKIVWNPKTELSAKAYLGYAAQTASGFD